MRGSRRSSTQPGSGWKLSETDTRVCGFARLGRPSERSLVLQGSLPDEWPTLAGERTHGSVTLSSRNGPICLAACACGTGPNSLQSTRVASER